MPPSPAEQPLAYAGTYKLRLPPKPPKEDDDLHPLVNAFMVSDVLYVLLVFRFINSLCVQTFFQPDEYFQSLEPAWQLAFGEQSGAWITWEWHNQLRSSLHPALFSALYIVTNTILEFIRSSPQWQATLLVAIPGIFQGALAAACDFYTWKLAKKIYGRGSKSAWTALLVSLLSPWHFFCSTRPFSNSLEAVLTITALAFWPWEVSGDVDVDKKTSTPSKSVSSNGSARIFKTAAAVNDLRLSFILAGFACIIRPTNILIWLSLVTIGISRLGLTGSSRVTSGDFMILAREAVLCGSLVLGTSAVSDYLYYGSWTFPAYHWLDFNIRQDLAVFYGRNAWHYYLSQGLPLLLTTYLPFGLAALWHAASSLPTPSLPALASNTRFQLAASALTALAALSLVAHKEVRFAYPLLPGLHVLLAPHLLAFVAARPLDALLALRSPRARVSLAGGGGARRSLALAMVVANVALALFATLAHQRGVLDVLGVLRRDFEARYVPESGVLTARDFPLGAPLPAGAPGAAGGGGDEVFAAFLMPCHSTPWRARLVHPSLRAWALTCEPPLHLAAAGAARAAYRDEADRFFDAPREFLRREVGGPERPWPRYVVGFEGIGEALRAYYEEEKMPGWRMRERWRGWNSFWIDDERRAGDVVVWEFVEGSKV